MDSRFSGKSGMAIGFLVLAVLVVQPDHPAAAPDFPASRRSEMAIAKVRPGLEKVLREKGLEFGDPVFIRIFKESKELEIWLEGENGYDLFQIYDICTFSGLPGPKISEGDGQSPEGFYFVKPGGLNPYSRFHLSFNIGYPNTYDRYHDRTGSNIMVHGNCVSIGCYAMTDAGVEEIFTLVDAALRGGQPFVRVHVFPFRMTEGKMKKNRRSEWIEFWNNLQEGYRYFADKGVPPNVEVVEGVYTFSED